MKVSTKTVTVHEAKTHFLKLIAAVSKGQSITICKGGIPIAQLKPLDAPIPVRRPGLLKGRVTIAEDFDVPLERDPVASFHGGV